ncbi:MAG: glycoside hydrolase family 10 protein [Limisphaerales bacterium]
MKNLTALLTLWLFAATSVCEALDTYQNSSVQPPQIPREFRGAWISEVASNADWPSQPGLSVAEQKAGLIALLDHAVQLHLNTVVFQVRPACDAVYYSPYEPWSEVLTGTQGRAPDPYYDPLEFAIQEAHKRGLELHAWFNPFRAWLPTAKSSPAWNDITKLHPEFIRKYGDQTWLDPGIPAVRDYVRKVILDVVRRYDVDGVQLDDYFYPYPQKDARGRALEFPDSETWRQYGEPLHLNRDDWRRGNVNNFIYNIYTGVKALKPWVKVGVSPFGIWRPGFPSQIRGLDAYSALYADSRLWLASGWVDYLSPQLYWPTGSPPQSFPVLLNWWEEQNVRGRSLWPGLAAAYVGETLSANEIARQVQTIRETPGANGEIYFHLRNLVDNPSLYNLVRTLNPTVALAPPLPWLSSSTPGQPAIYLEENTRTNVAFQWVPGMNDTPKLWVLQYIGTNNLWTTQFCPANQTGCTFPNTRPRVVAVSAVDNYGNISPPAVLSRLVVSTPVLHKKTPLLLQ